LKQLKIGGKMVIPMGKTDEQILYRFTKISEKNLKKKNSERINSCRCCRIEINKNDTLNIVHYRRSVRHYQNVEIDAEKVKHCIELATLSPNSSNMQLLGILPRY
jgi:hypothetical protein